ncbi:cyclin-D3-1-like isoform X2 [Prosopis cineraria]|uniref:cyclin-D3-1-like isoform X2 n=1 Tax=Prosopis cineraria TaxID=364024 RepID=UPI00240FB04C|nr:cyclin-D3-1-like isoform X2 [Prosopis cineraria]
MAHHPHQLDNPRFHLDALYCSEEHLEEQSGPEYFHHELEQVDECYPGSDAQTKAPPVLLEQDLLWDDEELTSLLAKERESQLCTLLETNPLLSAARREGVEWILKVNAHYSFSVLTAVLAANYLDRFLFHFQIQDGKPWMIHLAAVACLSLAAKVEETHVPLLLDLQVEESTYLFEAKTIKRMEILVLSSLEWKMNPVTPLSFLDYMTRRLGLRDYLCWEFLRRCQGIILSLITDSRFMSYLPSVVATATMMHVVNGVEAGLGVEYRNQLLGILGIDKDKVDECHKLVLEFTTEYQVKQSNKRTFGSVPGSPNGVMDASFSCDSSNDSWAVAASVSSSPEPLSKKARTQDQLLLNHPTNSEFLSIPP